MTTLLEVVQQILSDMDGDEVNSISDTEESEQVARHVVRTFTNLIVKRDWLHIRGLITLTSFSNNNFPTHFTVPASVKRLDFINYDKRKVGETRKKYEEVCWKEPDDFLRYLNMRDSTSSLVQTVTDPSGSLLFIRKDLAPSYYTSFDDSTIIMDSFDSAVDSVLQSSKVQAQGYTIPSLTLADSSVIDLPPEAISLLIEEATARSQYKVRQFNDVKAEQEARRQSVNMSWNQWKVKGGIGYRDYGRKR